MVRFSYAISNPHGICRSTKGKLSEQFYGGAEDMCDLLGADFGKYVKATGIR